MAGAKKLVIIDGKSVFYRGYYAMPNLSKKDGTPTGGVYGFAVMAIEVLKQMKPDYVAVAWDKPKTNIRRRTEIYPKYKANRKPAPPDFYEQVPILQELLDALHWPMYEIDDHEADDIMATFAKQAEDKGFKTVLVTSDRDVLQLVTEDVTVAALKKGLTNVEFFDPKHFTQTYQMTPDQFIDYKSLRGDPSDNIPGVAGVGEKTAKQLIADYKSLEGVYKNLDKVSETLRKKLEADKDHTDIAKQLVTLEKDVGLKLEWDKADVTKVDTIKLNTLLRELEFRTLIKQLPDNLKADVEELQLTAEASGQFDYDVKHTLIYANEDLDKLKLEPKAAGLVVHARTAGTNNTDLTHLLLSDDPKRVFVLDLSGNLDNSAVFDRLGPVLKDKKIPKIGYDIKSTIKALKHFNVELTPVGHDVKIGCFMLNSLVREQELTRLAERELGYEGPDLDDIPPMDMQSVGPKISASIWGLYNLQLTQFKQFPDMYKLATETEFPVIEVLAGMEYTGIKLDTDNLAKMSDELEGQISDIEQEIYGHANQEFNISSPQQLADVLFGTLKLPSTGIKKTKTGFSTAATELDKLRAVHPVINLITKYREFTKLKSTYVDALPKLVDATGRLHTDFDLTVAQTGRLSSHNPNLQNIPVRTEIGRRIREAFVAGEGNVFISADYSQIELRIAAVLAGDDDLIEAFNGGLDIHTRTAAQVYGVAMDDVSKNQRRDAKVINFGVLYGMSPHGLSVATGMTRDEAKDFIDRYFELRKPLLDYIDKLRKQAETEGFVQTLFGRRRPTPDVKSSNFVVREAAYRQAVNMPIQGTAADLTKMAMIKLERELGDECDMLLQIHDSILVETPEWKAKKISKEMKEIMESVHKLPVSLDVDITSGPNWGKL